MKVASNLLADVLAYSKTALNHLYEDAEIEAQFFLIAESILKQSTKQLRSNLQQRINQSDLIELYNAIKETSTGKPLQYVIKKAWFYNLEFNVNEHVLIPRPETEELVDIVLKENKNIKSLIDIGTGSGCIPISIKHNQSAATIFAIDIIKDALEVATKNAKHNNTEINFIEADILSGKGLERLEQQYDVIISNPPYIKISEKKSIHKNVLDFEPHLALFVEGDDEIIFYKKIIDFSLFKLSKNGKLYFELNPLTANEVKFYALSLNFFKNVSIKKDMSGKERFLVCEC